jgi:hypothetical protein
MNTKIKAAYTMLITAFSLGAVAQNITTQSFTVSGNCGMCEKTIERAALKSGASKAEWNKDTKILVLQFNPKKVSADELLKAVAYAGYDNEKYLAPNEAYENLHGCCQYERTNPGAAQHSTHAVKHDSDKATTETVQNVNELHQVYEAYFRLKDALVKDDAKQSASTAKELGNALDAVKMDKLGNKEHMAFMKQLPGLKTNAATIAASKDLSKQRDQFTGLSEKMYELMKSIKPSYPVYLTHCPMFDDGKGANWISKETSVKNPYYGSKMLSCGKVKETLK